MIKMNLNTELFRNAVSVVIALGLVIFAFYKWTYQYWKRRNVPYVEPKIPWGNLDNPRSRKEHMSTIFNNIYKSMKAKGEKGCGLYMFLSPNYLAIDLDLIKHILTKDFDHFVDRGFFYNEKDDPITGHLFNIGGHKWRILRTKLSPTFTSGKLKGMFQILVNCGVVLDEFMKTRVNTKEPLDIKEVLACYTTDVIGSCAFGLECNSFKDSDSAFRKYSKKVLEAPGILRTFKFLFSSTFPKLARAVHMKIMDADIRDFFYQVIGDAIDYRKKNNIVRKDFLQLLLENMDTSNANKTNDLKDNTSSFTLDEVVAQSFVFWLAGFETSSTTMTFALFELATNPDIQEKVRKEIKEVLNKHDNKTTYDSMIEMKYMGQVIDETLRKYPPLSFVTRACTKDYKVPGENYTIENGTRIIIPVMAIHYDEEYYENPEKFDPDRFNEVNKNKRNQYAHMPFGEGQRICIGMRFGIMQSKIGLTYLLRNYRVTLSEKTQVPLKMEPKTFVLTTEGGMWLNFEKIE